MSPLRNAHRCSKRGGRFLLPFARCPGSSRPARLPHLHFRHHRRAQGRHATHSNFCSNVYDVGHDFSLDPAKDVALSFLPLAHVYGRTLDYIYIFQGAALAYVESIAAVAQALLEVRPTIIAAVPRFFEKIYARLVEQGSKTSGSKRMIFNWAMNVAQRATPWRANGAHASLALKAQWKLADKLVYKKIRLGTGGHLRSEERR